MIFIKDKKDIGKLISILSPCEVTYTANSIYVRSKWGDYMYNTDGNQLKGKEMAYVKKFRKHFEAAGEKLRYNKAYLKYKPTYIRFNRYTGTYKNVVQIDINNAYPTAGKILGIIPLELYKQGIEISKKAALISIGSLHRDRKIIKVNAAGKRTVIVNKGDERIQYMSNLWHSIVSYTDYTLNKTMEACGIEDSFFYWCDAIFIKKSKAKVVQDCLAKYGFTSKIIPMEKIEFTASEAIATHEDGVKKVYKFPKSKPYMEKSLKVIVDKWQKKSA